MTSSDRPITTPPAPETAPTPALKRAAPREWRPWLIAQLVRHDYATPSRHDRIRFYLLRLEQDIAAALPHNAVSIETLRNVIYRGAVPSHHTARGLAVAFGISEIAILLRSGQLDWDAVTPLLGSIPAILRTEDEYRAARARLASEVTDPAFRRQMAALLDREWHFSQWLEVRLRWLGIAPEEWERIRRDLNTPSGRDRLNRALFGVNASADDDMPPSLDIPQEFLDAATDASRDASRDA